LAHDFKKAEFRITGHDKHLLETEKKTYVFLQSSDNKGRN